MDRAGAVRAAGMAGGRIWPVLALVVGVATLGSACAREADDRALAPDVVTGDVDFEATPGFLAQASERSALEAYRVDARMTMRVRVPEEDVDLDVDVPFMAGEQDGDRYALRLDMTEWLDELGGLDLDATAEMAGDGETLYIQGPLFTEMAEAAPPGVDRRALADLGRLDGRWGQVDLAALESSLAALQSSAGATGSDPRALLDLVASAGDVTELGTDEIEGTPVQGAAGTVSFGEMLDAQGIDRDAYGEQLLSQFRGDRGDEDEFADVVGELVDGDLPLEVWVDDQGYVRRVAYEIDMLALLGQLADPDEPLPEEMAMGSVMDFSDHGDDSIEIELPAAAIDVTEAYRALLET